MGDPYFEPGSRCRRDGKGLAVAQDRASSSSVTGGPRARPRRAARLAGGWDVLAPLHVAEGRRGVFRPPPSPSRRRDPGRADRRDLATFTVDPGTAKDHDDAISVRRDGDGLRVLVHIADVATRRGRHAARPRRERARHLVLPARPRRPDAAARARRRGSAASPGRTGPTCVTVEIATRPRAALLPLGSSAAAAPVATARRADPGRRGEPPELCDDAQRRVAAALRRRRRPRRAPIVSRELEIAMAETGVVARA